MLNFLLQKEKNIKKHSIQYKKAPVIFIDTKRLENVKDELEYAANWRRAFTDLYTRFNWLNAYAKINYLALFK